MGTLDLISPFRHVRTATASNTRPTALPHPSVDRLPVDILFAALLKARV